MTSRAAARRQQVQHYAMNADGERFLPVARRALEKVAANGERAHVFATARAHRRAHAEARFRAWRRASSR